MDPYDLRALFAFRECMQSLPAEPALAVLTPNTVGGRIALLAGSFNPPTSAHLVLAERALGDGFDTVVFVLARATAGKQQSGLSPEDRLLALRAMVPPRAAIGVTSASLYCDQAEAAARSFGRADVSMLVGSDKLEQIFDAAWYSDRDASLERLFAAARVVVAPRGDGTDLVRRVLARPDNRGYAPNVNVLPLHPAVGDLSSTRVRGLLSSGADPSGLMPAPVASLVGSLGAFAKPDPDTGIDRYAVRTQLVDALWLVREWAEPFGNLEALVTVACGADGDGERLRALLRRGAAGQADLAAFQSGDAAFR